MKEGKVIYYINGKDERYGNWLRYINCSRTESEQNLVAFQYHGEIYYRAYKDIKTNQELLVWYGDEYAKNLGIVPDKEVITENLRKDIGDLIHLYIAFEILIKTILQFEIQELYKFCYFRD